MLFKMKAPRIVEVRKYRSEGIIPLHPSSCPYNGEVSCISGSGSSMCVFLGYATITTDIGGPIENQLFIVCGEDHELEIEDK